MKLFKLEYTPLKVGLKPLSDLDIKISRKDS